jgi:hypothetical protein
MFTATVKAESSKFRDDLKELLSPCVFAALRVRDNLSISQPSLTLYFSIRASARLNTNIILRTMFRLIRLSIYPRIPRYLHPVFNPLVSGILATLLFSTTQRWLPSPYCHTLHGLRCA